MQRIYSGSDFNAPSKTQPDTSIAVGMFLVPSTVSIRANFTRLSTTTAYTPDQVVGPSASTNANLIQFVGVGLANSVVEIIDFQCLSTDEGSQQQLRIYWFSAGNGVVSASTNVADRGQVFIEEGDEQYNCGCIDLPPFGRQDASSHTSGGSFARDLYYKPIVTDGNGDAWALCVNRTASYTPIASSGYKFRGFFGQR